MYTDCFPGRSYSDRFTRLVRLLIPVFTALALMASTAAAPNVKNPPKIKPKKFVKLTDHTYACKTLTNFEYKTHPPETKIYVNLQKSVWKQGASKSDILKSFISTIWF